MSWSDCGGAKTHGKVKSMSTNHIVKGQKTPITGHGTIDMDVADGTYEIKMKASFISKTWTGSLCSAKTFNLPLGLGSVEFHGMKCPIKAGAVSVPMDITISSAVRGAFAKANIRMTAKSNKGADLLCVDMNTKPTFFE